MCAEQSGKKPPPDKPDQFDETMFLTNGMKDIFDSHRPYGRSETGFLAGRSFHPAANIYETSDGLEIMLDVPGVNREDVDLKVVGTRLTITGSRNFFKEHADEDCVRIERGFGSFNRSFEVPGDVDIEGISAKLENGVLTILVPRNRMSVEIKVETEGSE
jgi:HSP20 family protein